MRQAKLLALWVQTRSCRAGEPRVVFYHEGRDISLAVHGDDFTFCAEEEQLWWIRDLMRTWFEIKVRAIIGKGPEDEKEAAILGRAVRLGKDGIEYEADESIGGW